MKLQSLVILIKIVISRNFSA